MTKPMYCPLTLIDKHAPIRECTPDCAWAVKRMDDRGRLSKYGCAIAFMTNEIVNTQPLKEKND